MVSSDGRSQLDIEIGALGRSPERRGTFQNQMRQASLNQSDINQLGRFSSVEPGQAAKGQFATDIEGANQESTNPIGVFKATGG